jgi:glycerate kinase
MTHRGDREHTFAMPASRPPVIVVAPDSFKGSLDAGAICTAVACGLRRVWADAEVRACPMADGGEGTLDAVLSRGGERRVRSVTGAGGKQRAVAYGIVAAPEGTTAIIEAAEIVGITDPDGMAIAVSARSTGGVGELIVALLDAGVRRFMIGLGGSSTNDGGAGLLAALGMRLVAGSGDAVAPTPAGLANLAAADASALDPRLGGCAITIMSDVNNPLCGERGATAIFGPQKGVRAGELAAIDATLARFAALAERAVGGSAAGRPGAGAAGGLGFALQLVGGSFRSGAEVVADLIGLDAALAGADWAFTGEGRSDAQTLLRKAPFVVAERARAAGVPITLLSGAIDAAALPELGRVFDGCFALPAGPMALADCIANADVLLADRAGEIARVWAAAVSPATSGKDSRAAPGRRN